MMARAHCQPKHDPPRPIRRSATYWMRSFGGQHPKPARVVAPLVLTGVLGILVGGCNSASSRARALKDADALRLEKQLLERSINQKDATIASLTMQVEALTTLGPDRPIGAFAASRIEVANLSGGADFDGRPGDDGVVIYLRPIDADGDVVKAPGRIRIGVYDATKIEAPRVLGVYEFNDLEVLRRNWHGKFLTQHYTLRCPIAPGTELPASRRVTVQAEFLEFLTGATLSATKELTIAPPPTP